MDPSRPYSFFFEEERAASGQIASVSTILLTNRECPWQCVYCDLWKNTLDHSVPPGAIPAQIDFALTRLAESGPARATALDGLSEPEGGEGTGHAGGKPVPLSTSAKHLKLYNAGSFFDPRAIPPEDYPAIAKRTQGFAHLVVECHPALIDDRVLRFRDLLPPGVTLEIAMGLETANPVVLEKLNKRMTLDDFARASNFLQEHGIALRSFILVKPPFEADETEALNWARRSLDFAFDCRSSVAVLIPVRGGNNPLESLARLGQFSPPRLGTLEAALAYGIRLGRGRIFADLWDIEKFATCETCAPDRRRRMAEMNSRQEVLPAVECNVCGNSRANAANGQRFQV